MKRILIVDDEPMVLQVLKKLIEEKNGFYTVVGEARHGKQALQLIEQNVSPDIVLTDIYMPIMDGLDLIESISRDYPHISVVVLSVYSDYIKVREAFCRGAVDYLLKTNLSSENIFRVLDQISVNVHISEKIKKHDILPRHQKVITASEQNTLTLRRNEVTLLDFSNSKEMQLSYQRKIILKAKSYIQNNINRPLTLHVVADSVNISPNYLSYLFPKVIGKRFVEYITEVRIETAKQLMMSKPDVKIYEVAHMSGYCSMEHFSRTFKKITGISPLVYKKICPDSEIIQR